MLERSDLAPPPAADPRPALAQRFAAIRGHSVALAAPLSPEDCAAQSMPDASPVKWHLAHTSWFFETFILERFEPAFRPFHVAFRVLFNSYYEGVGDKHPRAKRGLLTRPSLEEVLAYRRDVDARILRLLDAELAAAEADEIATLAELGLQHEQQHQELILTDVQHLLHQNAMYPAYAAAAPRPVAIGAARHFVEIEGGIVTVGHAGEGFHFDNERPRHRQFLEPYALADRLVTNGEYAAFIADGGYRDASLWLSEGFSWLAAEGITHPLYWRQDAHGAWSSFTLGGLEPLVWEAPALQLSFFEAAAYAAWSGARLPTEAEWEHAVATRGAAFCQLFDTAWQWTSSSYTPYPGFTAPAGAIGEYNGKFMVNQYVLRGGSLATPAGHTRASYRNFFPTNTRWQYTGIRLAR